MSSRACRDEVRKASLGDASSPNGRSTEPFRSPWAALVVRVAKETVQEARRNRTATRAKRYAQCGPADMCARKHMKRCIFEASRQEAKMRPEVGRARRYAQCGPADMCAGKRMKRCIFEASSQVTKMRSETERARRYAQCVFVDMSAFKRILS